MDIHGYEGLIGGRIEVYNNSLYISTGNGGFHSVLSPWQLDSQANMAIIRSKHKNSLL